MGAREVFQGKMLLEAMVVLETEGPMSKRMYTSLERLTIHEGRPRACKRSIPHVVRAYGQSARLLRRKPRGRNHRQGGCRPLFVPCEPYFLLLIRIAEVRADE